jgi:hypothetical protein
MNYLKVLRTLLYILQTCFSHLADVYFTFSVLFHRQCYFTLLTTFSPSFTFSGLIHVYVHVFSDLTTMITEPVTTPAPSAFMCYSCTEEPDNTECNFNEVEVCSADKQVIIKGNINKCTK